MTTYKLLKYPEWMLIDSQWHSELIPAPNSNPNTPDMFCPVPLYQKYINPILDDLIDDPVSDIESLLDELVIYNDDTEIEKAMHKFFDDVR